LHVERYSHTRYYALYERDELLAVTVYRKGTEAVQRQLEAREKVIAEQAARIEQLTAATCFQERVRHGSPRGWA